MNAGLGDAAVAHLSFDFPIADEIIEKVIFQRRRRTCGVCVSKY